MGAKIFLDPVLHAKMIISDEQEILVSSANLIRTSQVRNHEAGIGSIDKYIVPSAIKYLDTLKTRIEDETQYCIEYLKPIDVDPDKPLCMECWKSKKGYTKKS